MRSRQEKNVHAFLLQRVPVEGFQRKTAVAIAVRINDVRVDFVEPVGAGALSVAREQNRFLDQRMAQEQPCQLESGIAGGANDCGLDVRWHHASIASSLA